MLRMIRLAGSPQDGVEIAAPVNATTSAGASARWCGIDLGPAGGQHPQQEEDGPP